MTNKTFIEEVIEEFRERFDKKKILFRNSAGEIKEDDFLLEDIGDFFSKHLTQAFIKGVESVGLREKKIPDQISVKPLPDDLIKAFKVKEQGYNAYHRKLEAQKQELLSQLKQ